MKREEGVRKLSPANLSVTTSSPTIERLGDFHEVRQKRASNVVWKAKIFVGER